VSTFTVVNDTAERDVKLMQDFHGLITVEKYKNNYVQEHRRMFLDCNKKTLKIKYVQRLILKI
jgi:hypothetical protein